MIDPRVGKFVVGVYCLSSNPVSTDFVWLICPFWPLFIADCRLGAGGRIDVK